MKLVLVLPSKKNDVLARLRQHRLDPSEFDWREVILERIPMVADEAKVSELVHRPTGFFFTFDLRDSSGESCSVTYSPAEQMPRFHTSHISWGDVLSHVDSWGAGVKRESEAPDLWSLFNADTVLLSGVAATEASGEAFTAEEQATISQRLDQIQNQIVQLADLESDRPAIVEEKVDYLKGSLQRMSRLDWCHTAVGVFFTIVVSLSLQPEEARGVFDSAMLLVSEVFQKLVQ
jgi:hypothetical protein